MRSLAGWTASVCLAAGAALVVPATMRADNDVGPPGARDLRLTETREAATLDYQYFPRSNYVWPFAAGPHYGQVRTATPREPGVVHTRVGTFRLNGGDLPFAAELTARSKRGSGGAQYFIVSRHPDAISIESNERLLRAIRRTGGDVMRHLPVASMIVRLTPQGVAAVEGANELVAIAPYHPAFKIDPSVGRQPLLNRDAALSETWNLDISLFRGEDSNAAAEMIRQLGGEVSKVFAHRVFASVHYSKLAEVAQLEPVEGIFERQGVVMMGQETSNMMQTGLVNFDARPFHDAGIRGAGQVLFVLDDGISLDAADLSDTSTTAGAPGPGHRKVVNYVTTGAFGGTGDLSTCDAPVQGGFTHGHFVSAAAVGNAAFPDRTFVATDRNGNTWSQVGVAPDGKVAFYDALITPAIGACGDPLIGQLDTGTLWDGLGGGSLKDAFDNFGVRTFITPFGENVNTYDPIAGEIDDFLDEHREAVLIVPVGNNGQDADFDRFTDPGTVQKLATAKNAVTIGSSGAPDDWGTPGNVNDLERSAFSAAGPAGATARVAPLLMAPGQERGTTGVNAEYVCRSNDNDNGGAVICDQVSGKAGTSFAAANAAGAAMLIRDYFASGFYPDGTSQNATNAADQVETISGALVTAVLVNSARFLGVAYDGMFPFGQENLNMRHRFNNEQGYGRVQLDTALPLSNWNGTRRGGVNPTGLLVTDGETLGGAGANIDDLGLDGAIDAVGGAIQSTTVQVCDDTQELRVALAWVEPVGDGLINDLNLQVVAPSGKTYHGNYYTDDDNRDGIVDPVNEDCPTRFDDGTPRDGGLDRSRFSIETCLRLNATVSPFDTKNNTESVVLSPNPEGRTADGTRSGVPILATGSCSVSGDACGYDAQCPAGEDCLGGTSQVEAGSWTIRVIAPGGGGTAQAYAVAVSGGVCQGSSVRLDSSSYVCNAEARVTINEIGEAADPSGGLSVAEVATRTTVDVLSGDGTVVLDSELGRDLGFTQPNADVLQFVADAVQVTDGTGYDAGNGVLDVRSGNLVRVTYADQSNGAADPSRTRIVTAAVDCQTKLLHGAIVIAQFGQDETFLVDGGCERNVRGLFEFGFPDKYMDADEQIRYRFAFGSIEQDDIEQATLQLSCVVADDDSPANCRYEDGASPDCLDPTRANNPPCGELVSIVNPIKTIGVITAGSALSADWQILIGDDAAMAAAGGAPQIDMIVRVTGQTSGRSAEFGMANRHAMNVDEVSQWYSTDFPLGGVEIYDRNNNGVIENPTTTGTAGFPTSANTDYRFETRVWSDMTACTNAAGDAVSCNAGIRPWFFDADNGGFTTGLVAGTDDGAIVETIAQWGEDKNFNNQLDGQCESEPGVVCDRFPQDPIHCGQIDFNFNCINLEDRDPVNLPLPLLDQNWSTLGGCGWQTKAPGTCSGDLSRGCHVDDDCDGAGTCSGPAADTGGAWHTGTIGSTTETNCAVAGSAPGQCQIFETIGGTTGSLQWFELLTTPVVEKVNKGRDSEGRPLATVEIEDFRWNGAIELPDNYSSWTVEVDTDLDKLEPVDLKSDFTVVWTGTGDWGPVDQQNNPNLTRGWPVFAPLDPATGRSRNGTVGGNRAAKNSCFFEGGSVGNGALSAIGLPLPPDDDVPEGFCPSGGGFGGADTDNTSLDPALRYCTLVCSESPRTQCASDATCQGTCINPGLDGFCDNSLVSSCVADGDCNLGTCQNTACNGVCQNDGAGLGACSNNGNSCTPGDNGPCAELCQLSEAGIDQFVSVAGPVRTVEMNDFNGPDMRFVTLEDLYGKTGDRFQGAIGFQNREARNSNEARSGFGVAVDDVVLSWREFTLEQDVTDCAQSGSCATINLQANNVFEGKLVIDVTVVDQTPRQFVLPFEQRGNDCDLNGLVDIPLTIDCNQNGIEDVVVKVTSAQETAGERVIADLVGRKTFAGSIAVSSGFDLPGVLFVAAEGNLNPTVTALYIDEDDGTGTVCQNNVDASAWGRVQTTSTVFITSALVQVTRSVLSDNGDNDGWADTGETVTMRVEVSNKSGGPLTGITLRATTNSPEIDCITLPFLEFGDLADGETRFSDVGVGFEFVVSDAVERSTASEALEATINISADANEFQSPLIPQEQTFDLDLDAFGGGSPTIVFEGFEGVDCGLFNCGDGVTPPPSIDDPLNAPDDDLGNNQAAVLNADGFRCQYSDPDWEQSVSFGSSQAPVCFPAPNNTPDQYWWQLNANRAYSGVQSLYLGAVLDPSLGFSTPTANIDDVNTAVPVALGYQNVCEVDRTLICSGPADCPGSQDCVPATPMLSFKQQVSFLDHRSVSAQQGRGPERGVMHARLTDESGNQVGDWIKLIPFVNTYDTQANSNYFNCTFDPTDDGNTEDDFFDPTNPARSHGPSSTCAPEFGWVHDGETGLSFSAQNLGDATDGPGLQGAVGLGTWVEPVVDLNRFRGRSIFIRYLYTSLKLGSVIHWEQIFVFNPDPRDDGWWIDDFTVTDALTAPATVVPDGDPPPPGDPCSGTCGGVLAHAATVPPGTAAPGQVVTLSAAGSTVDRCVGGVLQYAFWRDVDRNGTVGWPDVLLRDFTDDSELLVTPQGNESYVVSTRCGSGDVADPVCSDIVSVSVDVDCPVGASGLGSGSSANTTFLNRNLPGSRNIYFNESEEVFWSTAATVDVVVGDLIALRANFGFGGAGEILECKGNNVVHATSLAIDNVPAGPGEAVFVLVRSAENCNHKAGGSWGQVGEQTIVGGPRDPGINSDANACPE